MTSVAKRSDLINKSIEDACNQLTAVNKLPPTLKPPPRQDLAPPPVVTQPQTVSTSLASSQAGDNVTAGSSWRADQRTDIPHPKINTDTQTSTQYHQPRQD